MDNGSYQPIVDEVGEPQVLGQSRQSPTSFYLAHQWLYDDGLKDSDVVPWVNTNTYPIWNELHPSDSQIVDDQWGHDADPQLREPSPTCPPLARSTEPNKSSNVAEEDYLPATQEIRTRPGSLVSKGKNAATRRSHWNTAVPRIRTTHKISRESQRKRMRSKQTAGQTSRSAGRLHGLAQAVPDLATLPPMVAEACRLWLKCFPGCLPKDEEIVGLHLAFHSSTELIRLWFHIHAGKKAKDGGPQGAMDPKDDVALQYQRNRKKCNEKAFSRTRNGSARIIVQDERQPYACTSRCGATFDAKDCWRRHEEINFPQELWLCTIGSCHTQPEKAVRLRRDHFRNHLRKQHGYQTTSEEDLDAFHFNIPSLFDRRCILRKCGKRFRTWRERIDHVAKELEAPWTISEWRDTDEDNNPAELSDSQAPALEGEQTDEDGSSSSDSDSSEHSNWPDEGGASGGRYPGPGPESGSGSGSGSGSSAGAGLSDTYPGPSNTGLSAWQQQHQNTHGRTSWNHFQRHGEAGPSHPVTSLPLRSKATTDPKTSKVDVSEEGHENKSTLSTSIRPLSSPRLQLKFKSPDSKLDVGKGGGLTYATKQEALRSVPQIHTGTPTKTNPAPAFPDPNLYQQFQESSGSSEHNVAGTPLPVSHLLSPILPSGGDNSISAPCSGTGPPPESRSQRPTPNPDECNDPIHIGPAWQLSPPATLPMPFRPFKLPLVQRPEHRPPVSKVVGEKNLPGEGLCSAHEEGSYIKKSIDGEMVNAQWGVAKLGKSRKRLAVACMTCREWKIKCDPGELKCVQCDNAGIDCRRPTEYQTKPPLPLASHRNPSYIVYQPPIGRLATGQAAKEPQRDEAPTQPQHLTSFAGVGQHPGTVAAYSELPRLGDSELLKDGEDPDSTHLR